MTLSCGDEKVALRVLVRGRVQGVGFRHFVHMKAAELGLSGFVRNVGEDQVEALLVGPRSAVEAAVEAISRGPRWSRVDQLSTQPVPLEACEDGPFRVLTSI
jgi:acylphosphatase